MPKYLIRASLTPEGLQGLLRESATARRSVVERMITGLDGQLEAMYWAFGEEDVYLLVDLPDNTSVAAACLTVSATGAVRTATTVLLTPEEVDEAIGRKVEYRAPGAAGA
jgi:uncharacterized protein with GYD domain